MSLEYAFRPVEDPEAGLQADRKAMELAADLSSDDAKFAKVLSVLESSPVIRSVYEREREGNALKFDNDLSGAYGKIHRAVTDLITVIESEEFRGKPLDFEAAYKVVAEVRRFNPKIRLQQGLAQFISLIKQRRDTGIRGLVYAYRSARAAFRLGRIDMAVKLLENTLAKTKNPAAYYLSELLAFFYRYLGDEEKEIQALELTLNLLPLRSRVRHRLRYLYEKKGESKKAERAKLLYQSGYGLHRAKYAAVEATYMKKTRNCVPLTKRARYNLALAAVILHYDQFRRRGRIFIR